MNKFFKILLLLFFAVFLVCGSSIGIPTSMGPSGGTTIPNTPGYFWVDNPYWMPTDLTTGTQGESTFEIRLEQAAFESDFGLFLPNSFSSPTSVATQFEVFDMADEVGEMAQVFFQNLGGGWEVSLDLSVWTAFDNRFGFYYGVHTGGASGTADYTYFSDPSLNTVDVGDQHVAVEWNGISLVKIYLEDLRTSAADWDWMDMTVSGNDLKPIPEPATMLLLGSGLIGLAGIGRRKFFKK